jgi:hypothetical protein
MEYVALTFFLRRRHSMHDFVYLTLVLAAVETQTLKKGAGGGGGGGGGSCSVDMCLTKTGRGFV